VSGEPRSCYQQWREQLAHREGLLMVSFELPRYWLDSAPTLPLTALYCVSAGRLQVAVTDLALTASDSTPLAQYERWVEEHGLVSFESGTPLALQPEYIAKPWGQEVWYTGIEQRRVCCFTQGQNRTPIPWLQAVVPYAALGEDGEAPVLLKVLDPAPVPVLGDLYFELHEQKREVYVVTHVDQGAWPDGTGYIRLGFNEEKIAAHGDEQAFRAAYLQAVRAYEAVRRRIDSADSTGEEPLPADIELERQLRTAMDEYTHRQPLRVGDVVVIPLLVPHALQHGVRTIEFQTPVYERKILSFAQQVVTQDNWDTAEAVAQMLLRPPATQPFLRHAERTGLKIEVIVDFPEFEVRRIVMARGESLAQESGQPCSVLIVIEGEMRLRKQTFLPGQACLLPAAIEEFPVTVEALQPLLLLWATPR
jgi:hypothetical protein